MQQIIEGIDKLPGILKETGCRKLFLVIDSSYPFLNIKDAVETLPVGEKVKFSDFTPNPVYEQVCKGIELLKSSRCDAILAVGGGSAIDVAKCIKLAVLSEAGNAALIPPLVLQRVPLEGSELPFIAIPTTAGTGSESTHNAVMYYQGAKQTVTNDGILPDYAILEPSVLKTLPLYQKKCTMMDALCQGIESWWCINSNDESREYARKAVEGIIARWRKYIFDNSEEAARQAEFFSWKVDRGARAEDKALHAVLRHHLKESDRPLNVVPVVHEGLLDGLAYCLVPREVDYGVNLMLREDSLEAFPVPDVGLVEDRAPAGYFLNAAEDLLLTIREVVGDDYVIAIIKESYNRMAPDEAGAACYKYSAHQIISFALSRAALSTLSMS